MSAEKELESQWIAEDRSQQAEEDERERLEQEAAKISEELRSEMWAAEERAEVEPTEVNLLRAALAEGRATMWARYGFRSNGYDCPPDRPIKGNLSDEHGLVYHRPMWLYYGPTIPYHCFKTVKQAERTGYRASKIRR